MIGTILIASAHLLVAALARKREMGFGKALLLSVLLTPFISLPMVLRSKRVTPRPPETAKPPSEVKPPAGDVKNEYGYQEGGKILSDSYILSQDNWSCSVTSEDSMKVPPERRQSITAQQTEGKPLHL